MTWRIIETRAHPCALPRAHETEALAWRFAGRHGHEVWEITDNGRTAFERFLGQGVTETDRDRLCACQRAMLIGGPVLIYEIEDRCGEKYLCAVE